MTSVEASAGTFWTCVDITPDEGELTYSNLIVRYKNEVILFLDNDAEIKEYFSCLTNLHTTTNLKGLETK